MDRLGWEVLLAENLGELFGVLDRLDKDDDLVELQLVQKADWIAIVASILKRKQVRRGSPSNLVSREDYDAWTTMNR